MDIKCWGSRGSIPVSGQEYLTYGGDTTCLEIRATSGDILIVDAGTGIRCLGNQLLQSVQQPLNLIFTHAHWDHLMGFPFFKPLYQPETRINLHRCPFPSEYVDQMMERVMAPPNFPIKYSDLKAKIIYEPACPLEFQIGSMTVTPIALSHTDPGNGYKFSDNGQTFVFITDNELGYIHPGGLPFEAYRDFAHGADLLIHDAEYTPEEYRQRAEWGHSTYRQALDLALAAGVRSLGLFHHNQDRTDEALDMIVRQCKAIIAQQGNSLDCFAVACGMTIDL